MSYLLPHLTTGTSQGSARLLLPCSVALLCRCLLRPWAQCWCRRHVSGTATR
jgi:hypothetical protein